MCGHPPTTTINVLGPVAITTPEGRRERLPAQLRRILAVLAISREAPLSTEQIIRRVWDGAAPDSAVQMVRNQVRALRRLLCTSALENSQAGYRISANRVHVDAEEFRSSVRDGQQQLAAGRVSDAVRTINHGISLWRGREALANSRDVSTLEIEALDLEELRFQAEGMMVEGHLALGQPADALPILRAMTTTYPTRELPWVQLMVAQTLIGRRIEASIDTFRQAQQHLVANTGLDAPRLTHVHTALLRGAHGQELLDLIKRDRR